MKEEHVLLLIGLAICFLTNYLLNFYVKKRKIYNYWLLLLLTFVPVFLLMTIVNASVVVISQGDISFRRLMLNMTYYLPSILFFIGLTLTIQYFRLKRELNRNGQ